MKKRCLVLLIAALFAHFSFAVNDTIRLKFQPNFPLDSIKVENFDNKTSQTFIGKEELVFIAGKPSGILNPKYLDSQLNIFSLENNAKMQIGFNLTNPGMVHCEVYNMQGKQISAFSGQLPAGYQRFNFTPDISGIFIVRVFTSEFSEATRFVAIGRSTTPTLSYDGITASKSNFNSPSKVPTATYENDGLEIKEDDLLRITCYSDTKTHTIYDYVNNDKDYELEFSEPFYRFRLYNIEVSKPCFVDVMYTVTDRYHKGVEDLYNLDFTVNENGRNISPRESFQQVEHMIEVPFQIVLMLDNSASIGRDLPILKESANHFVKKMRSNQQIAIYSFSDTPTLLQDFTNDTTLLKEAIDGIKLGFPSTNLYGSVITALSRWSDEFTKTNFKQGVLVLFTDGDDTQATNTLSEVLTARGDKKVYVIGLGDDITPSILNQISNPTEYIPIQTLDELDEAFNQIQADIVRYSNSFYWLNYMTPKRNGMHDLTISIDKNTYDGEKNSITGSFSADGFESVYSGVYVNIDDKNLYGIDSIYCFYDNNKYNYTTSRYGNIVSTNSLLLKPTTYWVYEQPQYTWQTANTDLISLTPSDYSSVVLNTHVEEVLSTDITLNDEANDYTKTIPVEILPEYPIFGELSYSDVTPYSATVHGRVLQEGRLKILNKGLVWNNKTNPTISLSTKSNWGEGIGNVTTEITNLTPGATYYVRAYTSHNVGVNYSQEISFTTDPALATLTTKTVSSIRAFSAVSGGNITFDGGSAVLKRGVCWSTNPNPTIEDDKTEDGSGSGNFTSEMTDLKHNTKYYVRAYATNSVGTSYGKEVSFTTQTGIMSLTTKNTSSIRAYSAVSGGNITYDGGADVIIRGVCWSTNPNPTIDDNKTEDGSGIGSFTSTLTNLELATKYYVRAYATNSVGTSYGEEVSFTTQTGIVSLTTKSISPITAHSSQSGGSITNDGGVNVTIKGVCWSINPNPTIDDNKTEDGSGAGSFTSTLTNLELVTKYYIRAYATNSVGTSYGDEKILTTDGYKSYIFDIDANEYSTIGIGGREWMAENLKTTKYNDGITIPYVENDYFWGDRNTPAYCYYNNYTSNGNTYGALYNWYAVNIGKLCPKGWHVPSDAEWTELENYLANNGYNYDGSIGGGRSKIAKAIASESGWKFSNKVGSVGKADYLEYRNKSGFSATPGGYRLMTNGEFINNGYGGYWWSSSEENTYYAYRRSLLSDYDNVARNSNYKQYGSSVRCVRDK